MLSGMVSTCIRSSSSFSKAQEIRLHAFGAGGQSVHIALQGRRGEGTRTHQKFSLCTKRQKTLIITKAKEDKKGAAVEFRILLKASGKSER